MAASELPSSGERFPRKEEKPCVFCEINAGSREGARIAETKEAVAIISLEGHPLVLPKKHITVEQAQENPELVGGLYSFAFSLLEPTKKALGASGVSMVTNLGRSAGQEFDHLHVHLIDRQRGDRKVRFRELESKTIEERNILASRIASSINPK